MSIWAGGIWRSERSGSAYNWNDVRIWDDTEIWTEA